MTTDSQATADPRPLFFRAADQAERVVDAVPLDRLGEPTPCAEFDVRTLLGHFVSVMRRIDTVGRGGHPFDVPHVTTDVPDDRLAEAFRDARAAVEKTWSEDAVLDATLTLPWGEMPGRFALGGYVTELATHTWDVATAAGDPAALDPGIAEAALESARMMLPAEPRGGDVPFGPVVDVPGDAGAYDRLVAWMGRRP